MISKPTRATTLAKKRSDSTKWAKICLIAFVTTWVLFGLTEAFYWYLSVNGLINLKDVPPFGTEQATNRDYLTNVWIWESVLFIMGVGVVAVTILALAIVIKRVSEKWSRHPIRDR